ncbi:hypothetical protein GCM10017673_27310 [Streptosporangium violaceochromogenes]|nr:hypothetical protein GCM10017673_27310 [Streptosporangium violaceochromogenes]
MESVRFRDGKAVGVVKRFSCGELVDLVTAYLENDLDDPTLRRLQEHLAGCEGCRRYLAQFRATVGALGALPPEPLAAPARERLLAAFRRRRRP